jgi:hypothetical protein
MLQTQERFFKSSLARLLWGRRKIVFRLPTLWSIRPPGQGLMGAMYLGVKRPGHEYNDSIRPVTSLRMSEAVHPLTCVSSCGLLRQLPFIQVLT